MCACGDGRAPGRGRTSARLRADPRESRRTDWGDGSVRPPPAPPAAPAAGLLPSRRGKPHDGERAPAHAGGGADHRPRRQPRRPHGRPSRWDAPGTGSGPCKPAACPPSRSALGADYPIVPMDLQFFQGDFGTFPGIGPIPSRIRRLSTQKWIARRPLRSFSRSRNSIGWGSPSISLRVAQNIAREDLRGQRQVVTSDVKRATTSSSRRRVRWRPSRRPSGRSASSTAWWGSSSRSGRRSGPTAWMSRRASPRRSRRLHRRE